MALLLRPFTPSHATSLALFYPVPQAPPTSVPARDWGTCPHPGSGPRQGPDLSTNTVGAQFQMQETHIPAVDSHLGRSGLCQSRGGRERSGVGLAEGKLTDVMVSGVRGTRGRVSIIAQTAFCSLPGRSAPVPVVSSGLLSILPPILFFSCLCLPSQSEKSPTYSQAGLFGSQFFLLLCTGAQENDLAFLNLSFLRCNSNNNNNK